MKSLLPSIIAISLLQASSAQTPSSIDLSGSWKLALDAKDLGLAGGPSSWHFDDKIILPNTLTLAGKGEPLRLETKLDKPTLSNLHQRYSYVGPAWYQRDVEIPAAWAQTDVLLEFERVLWESRLWVNGKEAGMRDSLCTPHRYEIGKLLHPGANTLTLRIDNREKYPIGMGHAYTNATQTIWNGVVGNMRITPRTKVRVEAVRLRPVAGGKVNVHVSLANTTERTVSGTCTVRMAAPGGKTLPPFAATLDLAKGESEKTFTISLGAAVEWSEFDSGKYAVEVVLDSPSGRSSRRGTFGYRMFKTQDGRFAINGHPVFLRGTLECCIFPKTGHPDMSGVEWEKIFTTAKAYGLNHMRWTSMDSKPSR